jgi:hypothetical protein
MLFNFNKSHYNLFMDLKAFFWEAVRRFYQTLKGAHVTKEEKDKKPWSSTRLRMHGTVPPLPTIRSPTLCFLTTPESCFTLSLYPAVLYGCETWSLTLRQYCILICGLTHSLANWILHIVRTLKNRVMRIINVRGLII